MKIGYQGIQGSNSERASIEMAKSMKLLDYDLVPLVSSRNVIVSLKKNEIDYGVVAVKNSVGGIVQESYEAILESKLELVMTNVLRINHSLFVKSKSYDLDDIRLVASHPQAIKQCKNYISNNLINAATYEVEDTALAAKKLSSGEYNETTGVLCSEKAGYENDLHLLAHNIEDDKTNRTEFRMFKIYTATKISYKQSLIDMFLHYSFSEDGISYISKIIIIGIIFISLLMKDKLTWSNYEYASLVGGIVTAIFLFLTSGKLIQKFKYRNLLGHWKYYSIPDTNGDGNKEQKYEVPRVVKIEEKDGQVTFTGWKCDLDDSKLFVSESVLLSNLDTFKGTIVYMYHSTKDYGNNFNLNGIVTLDWDKARQEEKINEMVGWYMGRSTNDKGHIKYVRISKKEFKQLRSSEFL